MSDALHLYPPVLVRDHPTVERRPIAGALAYPAQSSATARTLWVEAVARAHAVMAIPSRYPLTERAHHPNSAGEMDAKDIWRKIQAFQK